MLINFSISIKILLLLSETTIFGQICAQRYNLYNWLTLNWNTCSMTRFHSNKENCYRHCSRERNDQFLITESRFFSQEIVSSVFDFGNSTLT